MIKAIVFDMDGTIIDSDELVLNIYKNLCNIYPPKVSFDDLNQNEVLASSYPEIIYKLYKDSNEKYLKHIEVLHDKLYQTYLKPIKNIPLFLKTLKEKGYKIGVFTAELRKIAIKELNSLGLLNYIDEIICFDDLKNPKPSPDGIFELMKRFHCEPHELLYVGDQQSDAIAAQNANVLSILSDWKKDKKLEEKLMFNHVIHDVKVLEHIIHHMNHHVIQMNEKNELNILQLTDLHLKNDDEDEKTYQLITDMIDYVKPDFIVLTGDQTMSKEAVSLYKKLGIFMDQFKVFYTFVFGNHDTEDHITYQELIDSISSTSSYLWFDQGPTHLGYSNHQILIEDSKGKIVGSLVMMDTHIDDFYDINGEKTWGYGSITQNQVNWYKNRINLYPYPHLIFFHIPLPEMKEVNQKDSIHQGDYFENPCTPPVNTNFFEEAKSNGLAKAMFFGHDHLNDFTYDKDGIILAYGRVSGHYDYAMPGFPKGARLINFSAKGEISTEIILHKDIKRKEDKSNES